MLTRLLNLVRLGPLRKRIGLIIFVSIAVWISFFDSHSLLRRYSWNREANQLEIENAAMRVEIEDLNARLQEGLSDEMVEKIAREEYGMQRPGDTTYRFE